VAKGFTLLELIDKTQGTEFMSKCPETVPQERPSVSTENGQKASKTPAVKAPRRLPAAGSSQMDVEAYLQDHGIEYTIKPGDKGSTIYRLDHCLFDASHVKNDAAIIVGANGTLYYKCFHNSCQNRLWEDARNIISGSR